MREFYPCHNMKTGKWSIKRHTPQKHGETDKTVFPHEQFNSGYEARVFLWEQGLIPKPPVREYRDR